VAARIVTERDIDYFFPFVVEFQEVRRDDAAHLETPAIRVTVPEKPSSQLQTQH
jgi:hypothetical protein